MSIDLGKMILIDHHAHSLLREFSQLDVLAFRQCFSESRSAAMFQAHVQHSVHYQHMLHLLGEFLDVRGEERVIQMRSQIAPRDYAEMLFDDASIGSFIIDDGFNHERTIDIKRFTDLAERPVFRCLRLEGLIEDLLITAPSWGDLKQSFSSAIAEASAPGVVALKTIAAYRGGLDVELFSEDVAKRDFQSAKDTLQSSDGHSRITKRPLYHFLLAEAFELAAARQLPVQIHCGLGDQDADLRECNPLHFRTVLESRRFAKTKFLFLHCFPFVREAALLASLYANVYLDLSLSCTLVSPLMRSMFYDALSTAPASKLLAATDGHSVPETYWYASHSLRNGLAAALDQLISKGFLQQEAALQMAGFIFHDNARRIYALDPL